MKARTGAQGTAIGRFRIDATLGRGGMAVVYLAHDTELGRPVALKLLADHAAEDDAFRARFAREARIAARLSHPNIVPLFDAGEHDGRPFIVMEYVKGETLADTLAREGRLPPDRVVDIGRQCCAGLAFAHDAGLVHRDVKPQNLLVTRDGVVKIADFGVAWALDQTRLTLTGSIVGTARYLAPEQTGGDQITPAADVYALGVVLYELLAGRAPHEGGSLPELVIAKRNQEVAPLRTLRADVPATLDAAVLACLSVSPGERPAADALAGRLARERGIGSDSATRPHAHRHERTVLIDVPTRVRPHAGTTQPWQARPARRRRTRRLLAAALMATAGVVAAVALSSHTTHATRPHSVPAPTGSTPVGHAQHLARWIRDHTR
ncbi:MAG TPA: serine/threonine-protein kinase [Gaiellales bacterium]|jgi:serine/threonine-protein kinase|nr:serine/threonine-protein kinase [Gaiellales bacterium]